MISTKRKVVLDFDDTIALSSEAVINILNDKYNLNKTIKDLKDWNYRSIYPNITPQEVLEIYASDNFFQRVKLNTGVLSFLLKFKNYFEFIICSKGDKINLRKKERFCDELFVNFIGVNYKFIGIEFNGEQDSTLDKSSLDFSDCVFCVDDNTSSLLSINTPKKILLKNYADYYWNKTPKNSDNIYVINNFYELIEMCDFDLKLLKEGFSIEQKM